MRPVLLFLVLSSGFAQTAVELFDAKYRGDAGLSSLTFNFSDPPRFRHTRMSARQFRLTFPNTTSEKYASRVPIIFKSGHAKSLSFDFTREDTMAVIVTLQANVEYDLRTPKGGRLIVVDFYVPETAIGGEAAADVASLVKQEIERVNAPQRAQTAAAPSKSGFIVQTIPLVVSLVISMAGTAALMYRIMKRMPDRKKIIMPEKREEPAGVEAILSQAKLILEEKASSRRLRGSEQSGDDGEDAELSLARKFGRAQGEFKLAKTLEAGSREYKKLQTLDAQRLDAQRRGSVARAKKLGVGRGELELAHSLRRMDATKRRKERLT